MVRLRILRPCSLLFLSVPRSESWRPTLHKIGHFGDVPQANLLASYERTKSNTTKAHTHQSKEMHKRINRKKLKPGLVASYDFRPGKGVGLFWFRRFINLSLTHLLKTVTHLLTAPSPHGVTSGQSNSTKRPHRRRIWTVQSYSQGGANVYPHLMHPQPKGHLGRFSRLGWAHTVTNRPTDHATWSVTILATSFYVALR